MRKPRLRLSAGFLLLCSLIASGDVSAAVASQARQQAAAKVAAGDPLCRSLGDFYWEIGDANGVQGSGSIGNDYSAGETLRIASASKFVWGAYVLEKIGKNAQPTPEQINYLEMKSGYSSFNPLFCALTKTVGTCLLARNNGQVDSQTTGRFAYGGGHDQRLAVNLGLGRLNADAFTSEILSYLGSDLGFSYRSPQPAGGMESSPAEFGKFLRKVLRGDLRLKQFLGYAPVCTNPATCPGSAESPVPESWHYSLNHWVEDDPSTGDGAYSSPGLLGFYPWISKDKSTYGILARQKLSKTAAWDSVACGRKIRAAWMQTKP